MRAAPHFGQNFAWPGAEVPQLGQITTAWTVGGGGVGTAVTAKSTSFLRSTTSSTESTSSHGTSISERDFVVTRKARLLLRKSTETSFTVPTNDPLLSITCIPAKRCEETNFGDSFDNLMHRGPKGMFA